MSTRAEQIFERFKTFHASNPEVWRLFQKFAFDIMARGLDSYSAYAIVERIRWHVSVETRGDSVKINNDFRPYYARMFVAKFPEHAGLFATRRRTSDEYPAYDNDIPVFNTGPSHGEAQLRDELRGMA
jgi:hypothetical protein